MQSEKTYRGRGLEQLQELCQSRGGHLHGRIQRTTGEPVADIEFSLVNGQVHLIVEGEQYTSITNALHALAPDIATHDAEGSEGSGNVANNVIGNYAILKHVIIEGQSMWEILGGQPAGRPSSSVKRAVIKRQRRDPETTPAQGNLYDFFTRDQIVGIARQQGGAEQFQSQIKSMTVQQFADQFGLSLG